MSVNQFLTQLEVKDESWIAQPTHCRNVRPEGLSPVVLLEVNGTVIQARMSRN